MRGVVASAAPTARCRNCLRWGSFISIPPFLVCLFDHLVGDLLKMQWHVNTKCLGGLDIDHQLELRGLLDRQVGGLLTLENPTGVGSIQTMRIRKTASVAYQAAGLGVLAERKDRSYAVAGSQCCKLFAPTKEKRSRADHEPCCPQLDQACKDGVEVALGTRFQYMNLQPEGAGRRPQVSYLSLREIGAGRIDEQRNVSSSGDHLMQQFQPLRPYLQGQGGRSGEVAAGPVQTGDKSKFDRVARYEEDDRDGCGRRLSRQCGRSG